MKAWKALKMFFWLVCLALFTVQSYTIFMQYAGGSTTMTMSRTVDEFRFVATLQVR